MLLRWDTTYSALYVSRYSHYFFLRPPLQIFQFFASVSTNFAKFWNISDIPSHQNLQKTSDLKYHRLPPSHNSFPTNVSKYINYVITCKVFKYGVSRLLNKMPPFFTNYIRWLFFEWRGAGGKTFLNWVTLCTTSASLKFFVIEPVIEQHYYTIIG